MGTMQSPHTLVQPGPSAPRTALLPARDGDPARTGVRGLIFDVPDVLYDATPWRRWLLRLVTHLGVTANDAGFFHGWDRQYLVDVYCGRREFGEALQSFLLESGLSWAQIDEVEAASRIERQHLELDVRPFSGVVKTIHRLHELGLPLAAWSDSPYSAAKLSERLERLGLCGSFSVVLSSFDLEAAQPAPRCYQAALGALDLAAEHTVYVGHNAAHLAGARAIGLRTAAFNFEPQAQADHLLSRFEDVLTIVDPLCAAAGEESAAAASAGRSGNLHQARSPRPA